MNRAFGLSGDLPTWGVAAAAFVALAGLLLLALELRRYRGEGGVAIAISGLLATALAFAALVRPVVTLSRGSRVGAKVVVLVDRSRSMALPGDAGARDEATASALGAIKQAGRGARLAVFGFGEGPPVAFGALGEVPPRASSSDLLRALREVVSTSDEVPRSVIVISDGRLNGLDATSAGSGVGALLEGRPTPVHAIGVARREPADVSLRAVRTTATAVAHQPTQMTLEVGCGGGIACDNLRVTVRELLDGTPPALLASGFVKPVGGLASVTLPVTLDRAGPRLLEVAVATPEGDEIPDNNTRYLAVDVARERVRLLHVAGRPTYDVRALRTWLKSNASVDVVAFFILRSNQDEVMASDHELALIQFPVEELFTEHLPSFDAVILQDFNAIPYRLAPYLGNLANYVESGGGLVMVGGPDAFLGGGYDATPLERVLPVDLEPQPDGATFDLADAVPLPTPAGRVAPMLGPLRALFGDELPSMPGANLVGPPKPGALVLWEHPNRRSRGGQRMPLLTLGESGDGRAIAIAVDGVHRLGFSEFAARVAGRGHGALWDGLLGWLMRDPRFEPAQVDAPGACIAGDPYALLVTPLPGTAGPLTVDVIPTAPGRATVRREQATGADGATVEVPVGPLPPGGYIAKLRVGSGSTTRRAFACEKGGDEWADSRPDPATLRAIAKSTGGTYYDAADAASVPMPPPTEITAERSVSPLLPPWLWTLGAALALGSHWLARRRSGLA